MKPFPVSVQLYSVRDHIKGAFPAMLKKIAAMGFAGVEFAGYHGHSPKELRRILDDLGLVASSAHGPFPAPENVAEVIDTARTLGFTRHIAGCGPKEFETKEMTLRTAARAQAAADLLKGSGITFGMHNHYWEFDHVFDGQTAHALMMAAAPDIFAQIDTYWVKVGGVDPAAVVAGYGKRAPLLHIKDGPAVQGKAMCAVGKGVMNWKAVIGAAHPDTEWLVVELDECDTDMLQAVADSCRYLIDNGFGRGRA